MVLSVSALSVLNPSNRNSDNDGFVRFYQFDEISQYKFIIRAGKFFMLKQRNTFDIVQKTVRVRQNRGKIFKLDARSNKQFLYCLFKIHSSVNLAGSMQPPFSSYEYAAKGISLSARKRRRSREVNLLHLYFETE